MHEDDIHSQLREAILTQRLPPGTRLAEEALADAFGVSRTPMRNVLRRLAYERLVVVERNRGASVCSPTPEEAREVFEMRRVIEDAVVERAVPRLTPADLARLGEIEAATAAAAAREDHAAQVRLAHSFHVALARCAGNSLFVRGVSELMDLSHLIFALYVHSGDVEARLDSHESIVRALQSGDVARSREAMRDHLDHLLSALDFSQPRTREIDFKSLFGAAAARGPVPVVGRSVGRA